MFDINILFLTLLDFDTLEERNIYTDLLRSLQRRGNELYVVSPVERRKKQQTRVIRENGASILKVRIGNTQKTNIVEKGISTLLLETNIKNALKKHFSAVCFDLIVYSTPPITFAGVIQYIRKRDRAASYLLLKDIFPQNAVDIGMMTKKGPKAIIYKMFRSKEEKLYRISDHIGCMSQANVDYLLRHNPYIDPAKVHVNPNSMEAVPYERDATKKAEIYARYGIPTDATTFVYGGNLGRPQDIPFLVECLKANANREDRYFVVCGTGTEYPKLKAYVDENKPRNVLLLNGLPRAEYSDFVTAFDVGLIFLDHRFTIPNFPSRMLSYMQARMPVLACTDPNTDIGQVITEGAFGWWCESDAVEKFTKTVDEIVGTDLLHKGDNAYTYFSNHYAVEYSCDKIVKCVTEE